MLDPFSGSGTTLVQANEPVSKPLVSTSRLSMCSLASSKNQALRSENRAPGDPGHSERFTPGHQTSSWSLWSATGNGNGHGPVSSSGYLQRWFQPQALKELLLIVIDSELSESGDSENHPFTVGTVGARLTTHFDLDFPKGPQTEPYWCISSRNCMPTTTAYQF
ncbi:hypothetical protein [Candidatus Amarolinea dominans]|uniref:hypothetical protein n=1 Tax=Candidatus Amarolinea dominans TaxID=3140696 RepID=UPI001DDC71F6|nr:hypothetical protein [Anaerolineae bacterium]